MYTIRMSSSEEEITSDEEIDITEVEDAYRAVVEGLNACLKGLKGLQKGYRMLVVGKGTKTLEQVVLDSIGPDFGRKVINSLKDK